MLQPPRFEQSVITSLGRMVYYYTAAGASLGEDTAGSDLETLVFCTVLAVGRLRVVEGLSGLCS